MQAGRYLWRTAEAERVTKTGKVIRLGIPGPAAGRRQICRYANEKEDRLK